jgi:predicted MPP superfamily phosphohydrolase
MKPVIDPRRGDIEDDASSTKQRSMLSLVGSLLVEISIAKLIIIWTLLLIVPGLLLGLTPLITSIWLSKVTDKLASLVIGVWSFTVLAGILGLGWFGWRSLLRLTEKNFWSLNSVVVEPGYALAREGLRHLAELLLPKTAREQTRTRLRSLAAALAGLIVCGLALTVLAIAWPHAHLYGTFAEFGSWTTVASVALANSIVILTAYLAVAALIWGFADAAMAQPRGLKNFAASSPKAQKFRVAHLSDIHVVGENFGFRIESGRAGACGNDRLRRLLVQLETLDKKDPLDAILITGDMTDAGTSAEWAELMDILSAHPRLTNRMYMLPGNHDLNIVDRANPARMDLPTTPNRRLRQIRALSALGAIQGSRVRVVDRDNERVGQTLDAALRRHKAEFERFADSGRPALSNRIPDLWASMFPMVVPPDRDGGLGLILLNSNADTHFSFTNALGMITAEQMTAVDIACAKYPKANWIVALHHHVVEYPWAAKTFSERIGTALINGNWFARRLQNLAGRIVVMHGHRHIDWIGSIAGIPLVSGPSPVMEATNDMDTAFYIHTLAVGPDGELELLKPRRIVVRGKAD